MTAFGAFHTVAWARPRIRCSILSMTSSVVRARSWRTLWERYRRLSCLSMACFLSRWIVLQRWRVVRVVPPLEIFLVRDRRELRARADARRQALDHRVHVRAEEERDRVAIASHRRYRAVRRRFEPSVRPPEHHVAGVHGERARHV